MTRNVYLFQFSVVYPGGVVMLPYSAGTIWAYAAADERVAHAYALGGLFFVKEPLDQLLDRIEAPAVCGFSSYVWSWNYNLELARRIKARFPDCLIVFGGPQVPDDDPEFFVRHPWIDVCVHHEGEVAFREILLAARTDPRDFRSVAGLSYAGPGGRTARTAPSQRIRDLDDLPSPYLTGVFDRLLGDPALTCSMVVETSRGCPYRCTYCDWGSLTFAKVHRLPAARVAAEFEWAGRHGIEAVELADANFGIFKDRDAAIADAFVAARDRHGCPRVFSTPWAKNSSDTVLDIAEKLHRAGVLRNFEMSVQTFHAPSLEAVQRKNISIDRFEELAAEATRRGIPHGTELILGLPLESLTSWRATMNRVCATDTWFHLSPLTVLTNSEHARPEFRARHGIVTRWLSAIVSSDACAIEEPVEIVVATDAMFEADMLRAWAYTWVIYAFHFSGFTNHVARVFEVVGVTRARFYGALAGWLEVEPDGLLAGEYRRFGAEIRRTFGWQRASRQCLGPFHERRAEVFAELSRFIGDEFPELAADLVRDLLEFQAFATLDPDASYPVVRGFGHDFLAVVEEGGPLREERCVVEARNDWCDDPDYERLDLATFLFRKRRNLPWKNALRRLARWPAGVEEPAPGTARRRAGPRRDAATRA